MDALLWTVFVTAASVVAVGICIGLIWWMWRYLPSFRVPRVVPAGGPPPVAPTIVVPPVAPAAAAPAPPPPTPAPAAAAAARWSWSWVTTPAGYLATPLYNPRVLLITLLVLVLAVGVWRYGVVFDLRPSGPPSPSSTLFTLDPGGSWEGIPYGVLLVVTLVAVAALWYGDKAKIFAVVIMTCIIMLLYATVHLYASGELFVGQRRNLLYLLAIILITVGIAYVVTDWQRITGVILLVCVFILLGMSHRHTWQETSAYFPWNWNFHSSARVAAAQTSAGCSGVPERIGVNAATRRINGTCQLRGYVETGCVTWFGATQNPLAHSCAGPMPSVPGIMYVRADSYAVVRINHCRPFAPGAFVDSCS